MSALGGLMLLGFVGLLVSGFFLSQGYSIFSTLYFALAAAMGRLQAGLSTGIEATRLAVDASERYPGATGTMIQRHDGLEALVSSRAQFARQKVRSDIAKCLLCLRVTFRAAALRA